MCVYIFIKSDSLYSALLSGTIHIPIWHGGFHVFTSVEILHVPLETGLNFPSSRFTLLEVDSFFGLVPYSIGLGTWSMSLDGGSWERSCWE